VALRTYFSGENPPLEIFIKVGLEFLTSVRLLQRWLAVTWSCYDVSDEIHFLVVTRSCFREKKFRVADSRVFNTSIKL
jgi:hypothetical protein